MKTIAGKINITIQEDTLSIKGYTFNVFAQTEMVTEELAEVEQEFGYIRSIKFNKNLDSAQRQEVVDCINEYLAEAF